ncbi:MAG: hypothetical protein IPL64_04430 [Flavobacteriales bacterium]|nr:hypothetical protein [Flavobacteriales bacterium]
MSRIIFHLGTCSTCQAILKTIPNPKKFTLRESRRPDHREGVGRNEETGR